ncbi:MAG: AAA family ATPase [Sulfuritalea sp.]|nr:AAA family ATPase [Sulfuritalea sp.]
MVLGMEVFDAKGVGARRPMNLRDIEAIRTAALELPACRLIVIDPVSAYLGGLDGHNNAEVRALLVPLSDLARDVGAAVVCVTHLNKGSGGQALYRATGSLAFVAAARAAWAVARDKTDPDRRLFLPMKNNIGKDTSGLAYRIAETNGVPHVVWEGEAVDIDVDDALNHGGQIDYEASARGEAEDWLRDQLSAGPLSAKEITSAAREVGIARRTLDRAKTVLGIRSKKVGGKGNKDGKWIWELPESETGNQGAIDFGIEGDGK